MSTVEVIAALDRFQPKTVKIFYGPYDATVEIGDSNISIRRDDIGDIHNMLIARGFIRTREDAEPREGMYEYGRKR
jgi:hypothetical protein